MVDWTPDSLFLREEEGKRWAAMVVEADGK
jgi:hypothetical protein